MHVSSLGDVLASGKMPLGAAVNRNAAYLHQRVEEIDGAGSESLSTKERNTCQGTIDNALWEFLAPICRLGETDTDWSAFLSL